MARGVSVDHQGNIFLCGGTLSIADIASPGAHQDSIAGNSDAFLAAFDSTGNRLWGTYYGGAGWDAGMSITCYEDDNLFIGGYTNSTSGISTPLAYQDTFMGTRDNFLANFSTGGNLLWATYYGGDGYNNGGYTAADATGNIYVTGTTNTVGGIATAGAYQDTLDGPDDAYIARFGSFPTHVAPVKQVQHTAYVYPNPNNGNFTITGDMSVLSNSVVRIMDDKGNVVYRSKVGGNRLEERISLPAISPGYLYHELNEQ